jgi:hypothetical protein
VDGLELADDVWVRPSPGGAYLAATQREPTAERTLLRALLREPSTPRLEIGALCRWLEIDDPGRATEILWLMQCDALVEGLDEERRAPDSALEDLLPGMLAPLSEAGRALLADQQGFCLSTVGFSDGAAVELSALGADVASLEARHNFAVLASEDDRNQAHAWALVDAAGNSEVGFWPLQIGGTVFVLVLAGLPRFNHPCFVDLVWALSVRYDRRPQEIADPPAEDLDHLPHSPEPSQP